MISLDIQVKMKTLGQELLDQWVLGEFFLSLHKACSLYSS